MEDRPRILIVDDDELVREVLRETLSPHFEVEVANTGGSALAMLRDREFAVMVADQRMPQITGVELVTLARNLRPNLVSIILSAYTDPKVMIAAINEGQIFRFIRKPWDAHDLILTLGQAVDRHELGCQNERLVADLERRLKALEIVDEALGEMLVGDAAHPMGVLLDRLQEIVPHDIAALLSRGAGRDEASLELRSPGVLSEANAAALRDQAVELFAYFAQRELNEERLQVRAGLRIDPSLAETKIGSQVEVPLKRGDEVVGVLILQAAANNAFPADATRLLDRLANGTAEAVVRLRAAASREWSNIEHTLAALPDGVVLTDERGNVQVSNAAARDLLSLGQPLAGSIWRFLGLGASRLLDQPDPTELELGPERRRTEVRVVGTTRGAVGTSGILVVLRDLRRIDDAMARQREFISTFSHEIRTPLSSISAAIDLLLAGFVGTLSDRQRDYLSLAAKARDGLNHMVDQLLDLERYARGAVPHEPEDLDLTEWTAKVIDRFGAAATERNVALRLLPVGDLPSLRADPRRLEQVLANLLNNAIKFAAPATEVRVELGVSDRFGEMHIIGVHSEGIGIPPGEIDRIFDRFRQAKRQSQRRPDEPAVPTGSGLGLSICRSIVEVHGGAIMAESDEAQTVFWVVLPSRAVEATVKPDVEVGPVWVVRPDDDGPPRLDAMAAAAVLATSGLRVRLAPRAAAVFAEAREVVGQGLIATFAEPLGIELPPQLPLKATDGVALARVAAALRTLAKYAPRELRLEAGALAIFGPIVEALGVRPQEGADGWRSQEVELAAGIVELAGHIEAAEESLFPVRRLIADAADDALSDTFGVARLEGLEPFRLAYGASQAHALRQALGEQLRAALNERGLEVELAELPAAAVFAASEAAVAASLADLEIRFEAIARLHYRRADRQRGSIKLGEVEVPLVRVVCESVAASAGEAAILAAVAGAPKSETK